ncbi:universal stress protein [Streptomyces sp. SID4982]|uniref:universal stress protein n=1 Tax=Streptomyces sp. SID4982 TaxID=2690291 RepID=UPI00136DF396|nr:universal stress protein [Streptomyces sp. SID4982]MYS17633.1 universal stress protein [Streptomyces sp. SID4982]
MPRTTHVASDTNRPIVVGVDGSESGLRAVDWAADEAVLRGAPLRIVYASRWERYEEAALADETVEPQEEVLARGFVETAARRVGLRRPEVLITTVVLAEDPEYALVRESDLAGVVVLGCRGRGGVTEMLLGSVSLAVAGHAHCPVVVVRGAREDAPTGGVVLGVGGEPAVAVTHRFAVEEARMREVPLHAVRAWRHAHAATGHPLLAGEPTHFEQRHATELLEKALGEVPSGVEVERHIVEGRARDALVELSPGADLLVVGARRRHGRFGLQLGRVTYGVLHRSACPVAVIPELS